MDLHAYQAAGLYDPADARAEERVELLAYLSEQGFTTEQMVAAHAEGRLFGLAGDELMRPGRNQLTLDDAAEVLGVTAEEMRRLWRTLGFPDPEPGQRLLSQDEAESLRLFPLAEAFMGREASTQLGRVVSSAVARIAEAENSAVVENVPNMTIDEASELVTAQQYVMTMGFLPLVARVMDLLHRYQLDQSRRLREQLAGPGARGTVHVVVGFVDIVGSTAMATTLPTADMGRLVSEFEQRVADVLARRAARLIKLLGDGAMFVCSTPVDAVHVALDLAEAFESGPAVRVGLALGDALPRAGDYFGPVVNLAARLVALAEPGTPLVDAELHKALGGDPPCRVEAIEPQPAKGIAELVQAYALSR